MSKTYHLKIKKNSTEDREYICSELYFFNSFYADYTQNGKCPIPGFRLFRIEYYQGYNDEWARIDEDSRYVSVELSQIVSMAAITKDAVKSNLPGGYRYGT